MYLSLENQCIEDGTIFIISFKGKTSTQGCSYINITHDIHWFNINKIIHSKTSYNLFPACKYYIFIQEPPNIHGDQESRNFMNICRESGNSVLSYSIFLLIVDCNISLADAYDSK